MNADKPVIYICSPMRGDVLRNLKRAETYCKYALGEGYAPIVPHGMYARILNDEIPSERELALAAGTSLLGVCRELWICGSDVSEGMAAEIDLAQKKGIKIKQIIERDVMLSGIVPPGGWDKW